jgi:hypothetical protein
MDKKQTAVEWYIEQHKILSKISDSLSHGEIVKRISDIEKQAKEMEKERMIDFAELCWKNLLRSDVIMRPRDVYNETYGGDDE